MRRFALAAAAASILGCSSDDGGAVPEQPTEPEHTLGDPLTEVVTWDVGDISFDNFPPHHLKAALHGDVLYTCTALRGLMSFDVSGDKLEPIGEQVFSGGKRCQYLAIDRDRAIAYVTQAEEMANPQSFVAAMDISDPVAPREADMVLRSDQPAGIDYADDLLAVALKADGLVMFSADGQALAERAALPLEHAWDVRLHGSFALVANGFAGLAVVDLSTPFEATARGEAAVGRCRPIRRCR